LSEEAALGWCCSARSAAKPGPESGAVENTRQIRPAAIEQKVPRGGDSAIQFRRRIGSENQGTVEIQLLQLRVKRDQFLESARSAKNRKPDSQKSGEFCDANCFDDVSVFGSVDTRAGEPERKAKSW
jgi:hypothetical protein